MRSTFRWAIGMSLVVGLIAGCESKKPHTVTVAPSPPPVAAAPEPYPEPTLPPSTPADPLPPVAAAAPVGDTYSPPPAVDTTPIPPEETPAAKPAKAVKKKSPSNSYAPAKPRSGQSYTVKSGDTLQEISQKYYGTTTRWRKIYNANSGTIKDPNKLMPGMKLSIPK